MSSDQFIGRGEKLSKKILLKLLNSIGIQGQVNIKEIILPEDYAILDQEIKNHNFDFVMRRTNKKDIVIEVNFKHGNKAAEKWRRIFLPLITKAGYDFLLIRDWDCREQGLFWYNTKKEHPHTWNDFRDIIDALDTAGIEPDLE